MINRVVWIVLDSVGIGELPDAYKYGDSGSNTIGNISKKVGGLNLPNMIRLGLGNIEGIQGIDKYKTPEGIFGRFAEISNGKDTIIGHWEMAGIQTKEPFPTYPEGFPEDVINEFEKKINRKIIGNKTASGTEIIKELGEKHYNTGYPIVYTSADSVFQIAAHEDIIPVKELYELCEIARNMLVGKHNVARVIARPFIGKIGNFTRTPNRHDFAVKPTEETILDKIKNAGLSVQAVGKIVDIFAGQGITEHIHTESNDDGIDKTINYMKTNSKGLIYTNLVDFDMKWGHRNDYKSYAEGLESFDKRLPEIISFLNDDDCIFITADHGCDPTTVSTDHSREYVPFLAYGKNLKNNVDLKTRKTFADIGQTIADLLKTEKISTGTSFYDLIQ